MEMSPLFMKRRNVGKNLLQFDGCTSFFQLSLQSFSVSLRASFLQSSRSRLYQSLSFLQTQTQNFLSSLDDSHLSVAEGSHNNVEFSLFSSSVSTVVAASRSSCNSSSYTKFFLNCVNQFSQFQNRRVP